MPHVSRKKLGKKIIEGLANHIDSIIRDAGTKTRAGIFDELLTQTEKIMLAKRLGVLFLLKKGMPHYTIAKALGISRSTVYRFAKVRTYKYRKTTEWLWKQSKEGQFDVFMESLVKLIFTGRARSFKNFVDEL